MPRRVSTRMPVQQQHRRAGPAVTNPQHGFADIDIVKGEAAEPVRCHRDLIAGFQCLIRALYAKCDQLAPPQKQDDKHDDHDDNNCPDSNEHGFSLFLMAGVSLAPLPLSRTKQLKPVAAISRWQLPRATNTPMPRVSQVAGS